MCTELLLCFMVIMKTKCVQKAAKDACETKDVEALKVFLEPVTEWRDISAYRPTAVTRPHVHIHIVYKRERSELSSGNTLPERKLL
jgi:hypothetical protein